MARDKDLDLRFTMAENANLPVAVLTILSEDDNPYAAGQAERTLSQIRRVAQEARLMWFRSPAGLAEWRTKASNAYFKNSQGLPKSVK